MTRLSVGQADGTELEVPGCWCLELAAPTLNSLSGLLKSFFRTILQLNSSEPGSFSHACADDVFLTRHNVSSKTGKQWQTRHGFTVEWGGDVLAMDQRFMMTLTTE